MSQEMVLVNFIESISQSLLLDIHRNLHATLLGKEGIYRLFIYYWQNMKIHTLKRSYLTTVPLRATRILIFSRLRTTWWRSSVAPLPCGCKKPPGRNAWRPIPGERVYWTASTFWQENGSIREISPINKNPPGTGGFLLKLF